MKFIIEILEILGHFFPHPAFIVGGGFVTCLQVVSRKTWM